MIGIVIGHGGREPGGRFFRPEVEELERRAPRRRERVRALVIAGMGTGVRPVPWDPLPFVRHTGPARLDRYAFLERALG